MNIHFKDKDLFEQLKKATLAQVKVGSHMYGTNTENSDTDWLYIYATSENELFSAIQSYHQLQYIEDGVDHNFISLHSFIRNCLSGDSTINFEVIQSGALADTPLSWLDDMKESFVTYTIIRSYLGFARRDIKHFHKQKDEYNKRKRLGHIIRGYIYARKMLDHHWNFDSANKELSSIELDVSTNTMLRHYETKISELRNELAEKFNNHTIGYAQHINVDAGVKLNKQIIELYKSLFISGKQRHLKNFKTDEFVNAYENWVDYEK